jgi:hypothetical protein
MAAAALELAGQRRVAQADGNGRGRRCRRGLRNDCSRSSCRGLRDSDVRSVVSEWVCVPRVTLCMQHAQKASSHSRA